jgi:2-dehydro-3-deoxy-D-arabinonate dehydratase
MKIFRTTEGTIIYYEHSYYLTVQLSWDDFINRDDLYSIIIQRIEVEHAFKKLSVFDERTILAPILKQEVWAAGVTYLRSREARVEESKGAGGGTFYDKVYEAERPELFFKATAMRTVGPHGKVRLRKDSTWDVPEPELTLCITSSGKIVGYTIGNDMSSRSIEGENPLYLPQAKMYDGCAGLGPCIYVPEKSIDPETTISMIINRKNETVFKDDIPISRMKRKHEELVNFLYRECTFPFGCFLMTGTGIIPPNDFSLQSGDEILITIDEIGTLTNFVA